MMRYGWPMMAGGWGGFGIIDFIFPLLFWALLFFLIFSLFRSSHSWNGKGETEEDSALKILKERYARGEIDKKEFEEKKKDLEK